MVNEELLRRVIPYEPYTAKPHQEPGQESRTSAGSAWTTSKRRPRDGDHEPDNRQKRRRLAEKTKLGALKVMRDVQETVAGRGGEDRAGKVGQNSGTSRMLSVPECGPQTDSEGKGKLDAGISGKLVVSSGHFDGQLKHGFDTTEKGGVESEFVEDRTHEHVHDDGKPCDGTSSSVNLPERVRIDNDLHQQSGWTEYGRGDSSPGSREYPENDGQSRLLDQEHPRADRRSKSSDSAYNRCDGRNDDSVDVRNDDNINVRRRSLSRECSPKRSRVTEKIDSSRRDRTRSHSQEHRRKYHSRSRSGEHSARNVSDSRRKITPEGRKTRDQEVIRKSKKTSSRLKGKSHKYSKYEESRRRESDRRGREKRRRRSRSREKDSRSRKKTSSHDTCWKNSDKRRGEHRSRDHDQGRKREKSDRRRRSSENDGARSTSIDGAGDRMSSRDSDYRSDDEEHSDSQPDKSKRIRSLITVVDRAEISEEKEKHDKLVKSEGVDHSTGRSPGEVNDDSVDGYQLVEEITSDHEVGSSRSVSRGSSRDREREEMNNSDICSIEENTLSHEQTKAAIPSFLESEDLLQHERRESPSNNDPSSTKLRSHPDNRHPSRTDITTTPIKKPLLEEEHIKVDQNPRSVEEVPNTSNNSSQDGDHDNENIIAATPQMGNTTNATSPGKDGLLESSAAGQSAKRNTVSLEEPHIPISAAKQHESAGSEMETPGISELDQRSELVTATVSSSDVVDYVGNAEKMDQNRKITSSTTNIDSQGTGISKVDDGKPACSAIEPDVSSGGDELQESENNKAEKPSMESHTITPLGLNETGEDSDPVENEDLSQPLVNEEQQEDKKENHVTEHDKNTLTDDSASTELEVEELSADGRTNEPTAPNRDDIPDDITESVKDSRWPHLLDEIKNDIADVEKVTDDTDDQSKLLIDLQSVRMGRPELTGARSPKIVHQRGIDDIEIACAGTNMLSSTPKKVQRGPPSNNSSPTDDKEGTHSGLSSFSGEEDPLLTHTTENPQTKQNNVQLPRHTPSSKSTEEDSCEGLPLPTSTDVSKGPQEIPTPPVAEQRVMDKRVNTNEDDIPLVQLVAHKCPSQRDGRLQADSVPPGTAVLSTTKKLGRSRSLPSSVRIPTPRSKHSSSPLRSKTLKEFQAMIRNMKNEHDLRRLSSALKLKIEREHNKKLKRLMRRGRRRGKAKECGKTEENMTSNIDPGEVLENAVPYIGSEQDSTTLKASIPNQGKVVKDESQSEARTFPQSKRRRHHITKVDTDPEKCVQDANGGRTCSLPATGEDDISIDSEEEAAGKRDDQIENLSITTKAPDVGQQPKLVASSDTAHERRHNIEEREQEQRRDLEVDMRGTVSRSDSEGSGLSIHREKVFSRCEADIQDQDSELRETSEERDESDEDDHVFSCTEGEFDQQPEDLRTDHQQTGGSEEERKIVREGRSSFSLNDRVGEWNDVHHVEQVKDTSGEGLLSAVSDGNLGLSECVDGGITHGNPENEQHPQHCSQNIQGEHEAHVTSRGPDRIQDDNAGKQMDPTETECMHVHVSGNLVGNESACASKSAGDNIVINTSDSSGESLPDGGNDENLREVNKSGIEPVLQENDQVVNLAEGRNDHDGVDSASQLTIRNGNDEEDPCSVVVEKLREVGQISCDRGTENDPVHCGTDTLSTLGTGENDHNEIEDGGNEGKANCADTTRTVDQSDNDHALGGNQADLTNEENTHSRFSPIVKQPQALGEREVNQAELTEEINHDGFSSDVEQSQTLKEREEGLDNDQQMQQISSECGSESSDDYDAHDIRHGDVVVDTSCSEECSSTEPVEVLNQTETSSGGKQPDPESNHGERESSACTKEDVTVGECVGDDETERLTKPSDRDPAYMPIDGNQAISAGSFHPDEEDHSRDTYCSDEFDSDLSSDSEVSSSRESEEVDVCNIDELETDPHYDLSSGDIHFKECSDSPSTHHPLEADEMDHSKVNDDTEIQSCHHSSPTGCEASEYQPSSSVMGNRKSNHFDTDHQESDHHQSRGDSKGEEEQTRDPLEEYLLVEEDTTSLPDDVDIHESLTPAEKRRVTYGEGHTIISCGKPFSKIMRSESITDEEARRALSMAEKSDTLELYVSDSSLLETPEKCKKVLFNENESPDSTKHSANLMTRVESLDNQKRNTNTISSGASHVSETKDLLSKTRTETLASKPNHTVYSPTISEARNSSHSKEHRKVEESEVPRGRRLHKKYETSREHSEAVCYDRDRVTQKERKRHQRKESYAGEASKHRRPERKESSNSDHLERGSNSNHQLEESDDLRDIIHSRRKQSSEKLCQALSLLSRREIARLTPKKKSDEQRRKEKRRKHRREERSRQDARDGDSGEGLKGEEIRVAESGMKVKVGMVDAECVSKNNGEKSDLSEGEIVSDEEDEHDRERNNDELRQRSRGKDSHSEEKLFKSRKRRLSSGRERKRARRDHDSYHHRKLTSRR